MTAYELGARMKRGKSLDPQVSGLFASAQVLKRATKFFDKKQIEGISGGVTPGKPLL